MFKYFYYVTIIIYCVRYNYRSKDKFIFWRKKVKWKFNLRRCALHFWVWTLYCLSKVVDYENSTCQGLVLLFSRNVEFGRTLLYRSSLDSSQLFSTVVVFPQFILSFGWPRKTPFFRRFLFNLLFFGTISIFFNLLIRYRRSSVELFTNKLQAPRTDGFLAVRCLNKIFELNSKIA